MVWNSAARLQIVSLTSVTEFWFLTSPDRPGNCGNEKGPSPEQVKALSHGDLLGRRRGFARSGQP